MGSFLRTAIRRLTGEPPPPAHLLRRRRDLAPDAAAALRERLAAHLAAGRAPGYLESEEGRWDLHCHLERRLENDRRRVVPWLDAARPLDGARVLEIGCGTGSSTVALAEQGAVVTAVDFDGRVLDVARERCSLHGVEARFDALNATEVARKLAGEHFDLLIFFASLEHMTLPERLEAMRETWALLPPGALWCVTDTPNRLWYFDDHTSRLPFFHWLPDDLAFHYARFSPRAFFGEALGDLDPASELSFLRLGRGVSHHEFDLAIAPAQELDVVSSLRLFHRGRLPLQRLRRWRQRRRLALRYEALLAEIRPDLHPGFFQPSLDLILRRGR